MFRKRHLGLAIATLAFAGVLGTGASVHAQSSKAGARREFWSATLQADTASSSDRRRI